MFTQKHLEQLKAAGKIRDFTDSSTEQSTRVRRMPAKSSKNVNWMHWQISIWCLRKSLIFHKELQFHPHRKYRFDFAVTDVEDYTIATQRIGIEYQGGIFMETKSGHSNAKGATRDADKINLAQREGWKVLTFTALNYKTVLQELDKMINYGTI